MTDTFNLKVCTPKGIFLEESVQEVALPSMNGKIGVLPDHAAYTGIAGTGILEYVSASDNSPQRIVISGGFISFADGTLLLLADSADSADSVDRETYSAERKSLSSKMEEHIVGTSEWERANTQVKRIEAIDELISH